MSGSAAYGGKQNTTSAAPHRYRWAQSPSTCWPLPADLAEIRKALTDAVVAAPSRELYAHVGEVVFPPSGAAPLTHLEVHGVSCNIVHVSKIAPNYSVSQFM